MCVIDVLVNAVDAFVRGDAGELDDVSLQASVVELERCINRLQAVQSQQLAVWDARKAWSDDDSKSYVHRLARECRLSHGDAQQLVRRSRRLSSMPKCLASFLSGSLSTSEVDLLTLANRDKLADNFARDESLLLETVWSLPFDHAQRAVGYWIECALLDNGLSDHQNQLDARSASVSRTFDGTVDLRALFDPVNGEIFLNELERIEQELFLEDFNAAIVDGAKPNISDLARTNSQRRCDALVEMAKRSACSGDQASSRPLITVLVGQDALKKTCETANGTVLSPAQIVPLLSEAQIERIVFDSPSRVIEVGHKRLFTGALRRAIEVRDRFCRHKSGCNVPADRCDVDHVVAYARGGPTTQDNGQLLCPRHNQMKGYGPD